MKSENHLLNSIGLYQNTDTCSDDEQLMHDLKDIKLPGLSDLMIKELDEPIMEGEIQEIISKLKNNKSPGPDGYVNEFSKMSYPPYY